MKSIDLIELILPKCIKIYKKFKLEYLELNFLELHFQKLDF